MFDVGAVIIHNSVDCEVLIFGGCCGIMRLDFGFVFFFKHKPAYGMRISDWSSDVCSSDLDALKGIRPLPILYTDKWIAVGIRQRVDRTGAVTRLQGGRCSQAHQGSGERVDNVEQPALGVVAMYRVEIIIKGTADEMALAVRIAKATLHREIGRAHV